MPGPTPLTAPFRLSFFYTVQGFQHKCQHFLNATPSADPSGFDTVAKAGYGNVGISTLVDPFFTPLIPFYRAADCSFDKAVLEIRSGTAFVFTWQGAPTVVPAGAQAPALAYQYCIAGKDFNNKPINVYQYETPLTAPAKIVSYAALAAADKALVDYYYAIGGPAANTDAFVWKKSRGNIYIQRWLSVVIDTNEKIRRQRRIK